jgi:hypothetical protein
LCSAGPSLGAKLGLPDEFSQQMFPITPPVPEFIDPVFTKTSPKRSFSLNRKRAFWLVFAKTGSIISGTGNGNVGMGARDLSEFGFKVGKNSLPPKKIAGEISAKNKNNFFGT